MLLINFLKNALSTYFVNKHPAKLSVYLSYV